MVSGIFHLLLIHRSGGAGAGAFFPGSNGGEIDGVLEMDKKSKAVHMDLSATGGKFTCRGAWRDLWFGGGVMGEALSGFVLGWAGVGGVLR